ncbi:hypothetical protein ACFVXG_44250 [Kitasatospora sp. NPDC058162]|uniref:hypothetical protein n=1 Tax=Kitasatospora sp. NPDC058162 TaxID=3346362 RepID=UPI0036DD8FC8
MKQKFKMISISGGLALAVSAISLASAGTASAGSTCNGTDLNGGGGLICATLDPSGYQASYRTGSSPAGDWMDFNLVCDNGRRFGDNGAFQAVGSDQSYTYVFSVGSQGTCHVVLSDPSSGGSSSSPSA